MIRLTNILCYSCENTFDFSIDISPSHRFSVYCGICDAENIIDIAPYQRQQEQVFKSPTETQAPKGLIAEGFDFPKIIPGYKPDESERLQ